MSDFTRICEIINDIRIDGFMLIVGLKKNSIPFLQVAFYAPCVNSGCIEQQLCREFLLSFDMSETDILRTVQKALHCAAIHEIDEKILYKGSRVFDPHKEIAA